MAEVRWIHLAVDMFDDDKIDYITSLPEANAIIVIWVRLLTMAGKSNAGGYIWLTENIPYTPESLSHKMRQPLNTVKLALEIFVRLGMLSVDDKGIFLSNWNYHQNTAGLENIRQRERERKQKQRGNQALIPQEMSRKCPGQVPDKSWDSSQENKNKNKTIVADSRDGLSDSKPKARPAKPTSDHRYFTGWWCFAFLKLTGAKYAYTGKHAAIIKKLLDSIGLEQLIERSCVFLTLPEQQRFPRGSPTLEGLANQINQLAGKYTDKIGDDCFSLGILPDYETPLLNFTPWLTSMEGPLENLEHA
jgi:phage replisome organizer, putative, N-terminal region